MCKDPADAELRVGDLLDAKRDARSDRDNTLGYAGLLEERQGMIDW